MLHMLRFVSIKGETINHILFYNKQLWIFFVLVYIALADLRGAGMSPPPPPPPHGRPNSFDFIYQLGGVSQNVSINKSDWLTQ